MPISWNPTKWIGDLIEQRMHLAGQSMVQIAKSLVPVDTGLLKSRIFYTYQPSTKTLTLHADTGYAIFVEGGTHKMRPQPFLRPAINAVAPAFLTGKLMGVSTQIMAGTFNDVSHKPLMIKPHIRPLIAAANAMHNVGAVSRTKLTAVHMSRNNEPRRFTKGFSKARRVMMSDLSKLNKIRKPWN